MSNWWRHMKTTQEIRTNEGAAMDFRIENLCIKIRAARLKHNLPNAWDDVSRKNKRNWKTYRKTQYL